jgi:hypothetical protein
MTRKYENFDMFVTMSSVNPSARAARSALEPTYLNGSTATQKPSSARVLPEAVAPAVVPDEGGAATATFAVSRPALRRPSMKCSTNAGSNHFSSSCRAVAAKFGLTASNSLSAVSAVSISPSWPARQRTRREECLRRLRSSPSVGGNHCRRRGHSGGSHCFLAERCSERPGAVKGAPLIGAAERTLDGEYRSGRISAGRNGPLPAFSHDYDDIGGHYDEQRC